MGTSVEPVTTSPRPASADPVEKARRQWVGAGRPDESAFTVLVSMLRSYSLLVRDIERALRTVGLTLSRFEVLLLLSFTREERLPIMRLRDLLLVHGSSATYLVDRLVDAGWIERQADPSDRRVSIVHLTPAGRAKVDDGAQALAAIGFGPIGGMGEEERRDLSGLLATMRGAPAPAIGE